MRYCLLTGAEALHTAAPAMSDTHLVIVYNGIWLSGYEPYNMPGAWVPTRYTLQPTDGGGMIRDGEHRGMMTGERLLCIVSGGEYYNGAIINRNLRDFIVTFDDAYHDQYRAGVERGYLGKRICPDPYIIKQSPTWQEGYFAGRQAKLSLEQANNKKAKTADCFSL